MEEQEMAQMMERLLATINANQAKADANRKTDKKQMNANNKTMLAKILEKADANRKTDKEEMMEKTDANQAKADKTLKQTLAKMEAEWKSDLENLKSMTERMINTDQTDVKLKELTETHRECEEPTSADMKACQDAMEANLEGKGEPASEDMTPEVAHEQEVPLEDAGVLPVGGPRKSRRDRRHLAAQRRQKKE
jgi:hypothetical protein